MWVGLVARENRAIGLVCFSQHLNTDLLGMVCVCVCVCVGSSGNRLSHSTDRHTGQKVCWRSERSSRHQWMCEQHGKGILNTDYRAREGWPVSGWGGRFDDMGLARVASCIGLRVIMKAHPSESQRSMKAPVFDDNLIVHIVSPDVYPPLFLFSPTHLDVGACLCCIPSVIKIHLPTHHLKT